MFASLVLETVTFQQTVGLVMLMFVFVIMARRILIALVTAVFLVLVVYRDILFQLQLRVVNLSDLLLHLFQFQYVKYLIADLVFQVPAPNAALALPAIIYCQIQLARSTLAFVSVAK